VLGERLRELRAARGWSLRELARHTGLSAALLSQVENGTSDPSLATLRKLAGAFDESIAGLFQEPEAGPLVVTRRGRRMRLNSPHGLVSYERITPGISDYEVLEAVLAPGDRSSEEPWSHPSTECAISLEGVVQAEIAEVTHELHEGDAVTFDSRLPHRYLNSSDAPARLLIVVSPPTP
jgi:transcriptional regulator with XRE-family HTH domain